MKNHFKRISNRMEKSTEITGIGFFKKPEVKALRISYLKKVPGDIAALEKYARDMLTFESKIPIYEPHYATVHKIKGVGGTFGFPLITETAIKILKLFTVESKTHTCYLDEKQGNLLLDLIREMQENIELYKKEMEMQ